MDRLEPQTIANQFRFLTNSELESCKQVCRRWHAITVDIIQERMAHSVGITTKQESETWKDAIRAQRILPVLEASGNLERIRLLPINGVVIEGYGFTYLQGDRVYNPVCYDLDQEKPTAQPVPTRASPRIENTHRYDLIAKPTRSQDKQLSPTRYEDHYLAVDSFQLQCSPNFGGPRLWIRHRTEWLIIAKGESYNGRPDTARECLISGHVAISYNCSNGKSRIVVVPPIISPEGRLWEFTPFDNGVKLKPLFATLGIFLKKEQDGEVSLIQFSLNQENFAVSLGPKVARWLWAVEAVTSSGLWMQRVSLGAFRELHHLDSIPDSTIVKTDDAPPCALM